MVCGGGNDCNCRFIGSLVELFIALAILLTACSGYVHRTPKDRLPWSLGEDYALIQEGLDLEELIVHRGQQAVERRYEFHSGKQ